MYNLAKFSYWNKIIFLIICWDLDVLRQSVLCSDFTLQLASIWYWYLLPHCNFHISTLILISFFVHLFIAIWEVEGSLHLSSNVWYSLILAQSMCSLHCSLHCCNLVSVKVYPFSQSFLRLAYMDMRGWPVKYVSRFCTRNTDLWKIIWNSHTEQKRKNVSHRAKHRGWEFVMQLCCWKEMQWEDMVLWTCTNVLCFCMY